MLSDRKQFAKRAAAQIHAAIAENLVDVRCAKSNTEGILDSSSGLGVGQCTLSSSDEDVGLWAASEAKAARVEKGTRSSLEICGGVVRCRELPIAMGRSGDPCALAAFGPSSDAPQLLH